MSVLRMFTLRSWLVAAVGGGAALLLVGIPTAVIANPLFTRMTPVRTQDYVFWIATGLLSGLLAGTFALGRSADIPGKALSGFVLADLAIGCPICNKVVVLALGVSGALNFFAPLQFYIGLASLVLLAFALLVRSRALVEGCRLTPEAGFG
jgi:hypothetical protein